MTHLSKIYQHHVQRVLTLSTLALAIPWQVGQAATRNVDMTTDIGVVGACTAVAGDCNLRGAITLATTGDTINVPAGTYTLGGTEIPISVSLTITGAGSASTIIDGANASRIFNVSAGTLTINGVTIQHGHAASGQGGGVYSGSAAPLTLNDVKVLNNLSDLEGGGINAYNAPVTVTNSVFDGNISNGGGGCGGLQTFSANVTLTTFNNNRANNGNFGGLYGGVVTLTQTTFTNNYAANLGGGLGATTSATISNSTFQGNQAVNYGGGIYGNSLTLNQSQLLNNTVTNASGQGAGVFLGANMTVTNSTIDGNISAGGCGGVRVSGVLTDTNTIISNNQSSSIGGGGCVGGAVLTNTQFLNNQSAISTGGSGGGLRIDLGTSTLQNVVFKNNTLSNGHGAGLYVFNGSLTLTNTQFLNNQASSSGGGLSVEAGTSTLQNVLFANNTASTGNGAAIFAFNNNTANIYHATLTSQTLNPKEAIYVNDATVNLTVKNTIITNHATGVSNNSSTVTEDYNLFFGNTANLLAVAAGTNSLTGAPLFFNPAANDYHLTLGSAAIDKGVSGLGVTTDFEGEIRPFGSAPDIGWDEAVTYNLTLATTGNGTGTVSSSGTPTGASCGANCLTYLSFSAVSLVATATSGSTFAGWNCSPAFTSSNPLTANTTCTATFNATTAITHYHLSVQTNGTGTGNVTGAGSYPVDTAITLVATPNANSTFAGWSAGCSNNMTLTADTTCIATFNLGTPVSTLPNQFSLFLQLDGTGKGKITTDTGLSCQSSDCQRALDGTLTCSPQTCSQVVKLGTTLTLTPIPDTGSSFSSWGGHPDCATGQFLMDSGKLCIAYFHLLDEPLTVTVQGQGHVTDTNLHCSDQCVVNYLYGTAVTLLASPANDWQFQAFSGDCNSTGQVRMTGPKTCGATFIPDPVTVDNDLDHITSVVEDAAPNHGDGNGDGIPDSQQNNVASFTDLVSEKYLTLQVAKGCPITNVYNDFPEHYPGVDRHHHFPQGLTYFELSCAKTQVTVYYHGISRLYRNLRFYKFGPTVPGDMKTVAWYKYPATFAIVQIGGRPVLTATYTLTDGQLGDSTGLDGKIVDPSGIELK